MYVLKINTRGTRFVLLCNIYVFAKNKSNMRYICFNVECFVFMLEINLVHARFVLAYNACGCAKNKSNMPKICFTL